MYSCVQMNTSLNQEEFEDTKRGNQTPLTEGGETTQWTKERSTKHTHKAKDRVIIESNISKQPSSTLKYGV